MKTVKTTAAERRFAKMFAEVLEFCAHKLDATDKNDFADELVQDIKDLAEVLDCPCSYPVEVIADYATKWRDIARLRYTVRCPPCSG